MHDNVVFCLNAGSGFVQGDILAGERHIFLARQAGERNVAIRTDLEIAAGDNAAGMTDARPGFGAD